MSVAVPLYILLMGVQGAGKGTQAQKLKEYYGIPHVSTGDIFRDMKNQDTPLAREIQQTMAAGNLVSDESTIAAVRERLKKGDVADGVLLDGFPRTLPQAQALDAMLAEMGRKVTVVPYLDLRREEAIERIVDRWICSQNSAHAYNLKTNPPQVAGKCDIDDAPLIQRKDDTPEAAAKRIDAFFAQTMPLLDYYRERQILRYIDARNPIDQVTAELIEKIDAAIKAG